LNVSNRLALCKREHVVQSLSRVRAHAVLLVAPGDVGRDELARHIAVTWANLSPPFADLWERDAPIPIDVIRQLRRMVAERPYAGDSRVVLVTCAERLTPVAQNALLRLVEEPPPHVRFLFTAAQAAALLPTLRSRLAPYRLQPLSRDDFATCLREARLPAAPADVDSLFDAAGGWPVRAAQLLAASETALPEDIGADAPFSFLGHAASAAQDPEGAFRRLRRGLQAARRQSGADVYRRALLLVGEAEDRLRRNQAPQLVFENLFLDLQGVFTRRGD
jgi:hypothetical protein